MSKAKSSFPDDDDDDYTESSSGTSSDEESLSDSSSSVPPRTKTRSARGKKSPANTALSSDEDSSEGEEERIAIAKQQEALELARSRKGQFASKGKDKKSMPLKRQKAGPHKNSKKKSFKSGSCDDADSVPSKDPVDDVDLDAMVEEAMAGCRMSVLHSLCWWRIVLDEAHAIKSRSSQTAAAAFSLTGIHRWALSGTPLQNRVGEFYSLIRFLRINPMAHYFCRQKVSPIQIVRTDNIC